MEVTSQEEEREQGNGTQRQPPSAHLSLGWMALQDGDPWEGPRGAASQGRSSFPKCVSEEALPSGSIGPCPCPLPPPSPLREMGPSAWSRAHAAPRAFVHLSQPLSDVTETPVSSLRPREQSWTPWHPTLLSAARPLSRALSLTTVAGKEANPGAPLPTLCPFSSNSAHAPPHPQSPCPLVLLRPSIQCVTPLSWPSLLQAPASH